MILVGMKKLNKYDELDRVSVRRPYMFYESESVKDIYIKLFKSVEFLFDTNEAEIPRKIKNDIE